ncbi:Spy/CpxP family protein refolding chaperone [Andreprevotia chitinilytica]|uniref:Spy/CpxP family protein refolding chaperone n=1 Tax=Andreprevotia chitinilytica TaxID=396808 RepID=UPI0006900D26|nr:Spy/CpxP family protein refolding chaperone [Andreprevotia chitinilytica]
MNIKHRFGIAALSAALLGGGAYSFAATASDAMGQPPQVKQHDGHFGLRHADFDEDEGHGGKEGFEHGPRGHHGDFFEHLDLSQQQKDQLFQLKHAQEPALYEKRKALRQAHEALRDLTTKPGADAGQIRKLADAEGKAMADLTVLRVEFEQKAFAILTPEQRQKAQQMREKFKDGKEGKHREPPM